VWLLFVGEREREREKREEVFKFCLAEVNGENESLRPDVLLLK
jgi:hypothetical protein